MPFKPPPDRALADERSGRAEGDHDKGGEPPARAILDDATYAKEEQEEKADAVDRAEDVDHRLGTADRGADKRNEQDEVDDHDECG